VVVSRAALGLPQSAPVDLSLVLYQADGSVARCIVVTLRRLRRRTPTTG
jgi:hypothetical protein